MTAPGGERRDDLPGTMLNSVVRPYLCAHLAGDYALDEEGRRRVLDANRAIDEVYAGGHDHRPDPWWTRMVEARLRLLPPARRDTLVDLGCGTGLLTIALMSAGGFRQCLSVDLSAAMLRALRAVLAREGVSGVRTARADVTRLPLADGSVDCVAGNSMLHHLPDVPAFLREVHRVLRPGGVLLLSHEPTVSAEALEGLFKRPAGRLLRAVRRVAGAGAAPVPAGPPAFTDLWVFDQARVRRVLEDAGFAQSRIAARGFLATPPCSFLDRVSWRLAGRLPPARLYGPLRDALDVLDDAVPRRVLSPDRFSSFAIAARKGDGPDAAPRPVPLESLLRCPRDRRPLRPVAGGLRNPRLRLTYPEDPQVGIDFDAPERD